MEPVTNDSVMILCLRKKKATLKNCCGIASLAKSASELRPVRILGCQFQDFIIRKKLRSGAELIC